MNYTSLNYTEPILTQIPKTYKSAALLLHPFVQMPKDFGKKASLQEQLQYGMAITWHEIMELCDFQSLGDVLLALLTQSLAIGAPYARLDLAQKLNNTLPKNILLPTHDKISPFLWSPFLKAIQRNKSSQLYWSSPILRRSITIPLNLLTADFFFNLSNQDCLLADAQQQFVWISPLDGYATVFLSYEAEIESLLQLLKIEAIVCDESTMLWFAFSHTKP